MLESQYANAPQQLRRALLALSLGVLAFVCFLILRPIMAPIVWATILGYASWPLYRRLRTRFATFNTSAALLMTVLMICAVVVPVIWLVALLEGELANAYKVLSAFLTQGPHLLPAPIRDFPGLGPLLQENLNRYTGDPSTLGREALEWMRQSSAELTGIIGDIGRNLAKLLLTLLILFFVYRDGRSIVEQASRVTRRFLGDRVTPYVQTAGAITRAVLYGLLITAVAQGLMAGLGYQIMGLHSPVLLGFLTGVLSVVPGVGTAIVFVPISAGLIISGSLLKGVLLLIWCFVLVHPIDNVLRPLLISNAARLPFLIVMFGAIGGLTCFGLVGIFVGPVLLGVAMSIWREWAAVEHPDPVATETRPPPVATEARAPMRQEPGSQRSWGLPARRN